MGRGVHKILLRAKKMAGVEILVGGTNYFYSYKFLLIL